MCSYVSCFLCFLRPVSSLRANHACIPPHTRFSPYCSKKKYYKQSRYAKSRCQLGMTLFPAMPRWISICIVFMLRLQNDIFAFTSCMYRFEAVFFPTWMGKGLREQEVKVVAFSTIMLVAVQALILCRHARTEDKAVHLWWWKCVLDHHGPHSACLPPFCSLPSQIALQPDLIVT